jgi:heterodisulfide reductase subunit A
MDKLGTVLVIGAGVGGMKASLDLAGVGFKVYLCDRSPAIGGKLIQLDKWFPDNHCGMCQMLPTLSGETSPQFCLRRGLLHPNIELLPRTEIEKVEGESGDFRVTVNSRATGVNSELCTGCGLCAEVCPVETASEFNEGLEPRRAIFAPYPHTIPHLYTIDWDICTKCGVCVEKCPTQAIQLADAETTKQLQAGAIILSTGFEEFDARLTTQYGYKRYPNVINSLELERMLSSGGPFGGELVRPADGRTPRSVAFLQCIGSRDYKRGYCSSACCMIALKEAALIKQLNPQIDVHIFFMDMRAFGKGHYRYYEQVKEASGVKFSRCRVPVVKEDPPTRDLFFTAIAENETLIKRRFELVVLSAGQTPSARFRELCQVLGVETNKWGFCRTQIFSPVETTRDGVYVCGCASAPKDIADTLIEAEAAAGQAAGLLSPRQPASALPEKLTEDEEVRLGVFLCACGSEIASVLDFEKIADFSRQLSGVVHVEPVHYLCHDEDWGKISKAVRKQKINRLVIGACSQYVDVLLYSRMAPEIKLNPSFVQTVNLREQVAWVHRDEPEKATEKAKILLAIAIERAKSQELLPPSSTKITPGALVIGGGLAGLTAALNIARHGFEVHLVEKSPELGGNLKHVYSTLEGGETQPLLKQLVSQVRENRLIHLYLESEAVKINGYVGNFKVGLRGRDSNINHFEVGVIIVAAGGQEYRPKEYLCGQNKQVITQQELEERLSTAKLDPQSLKSVVMIQCVGSRDKERPYCSRVCCSQALKNALKLKEANPEIEVAVLYRDMMSYGFKEEYYTQAREKGVNFICYELADKPEVKEENGKLAVEMTEPVLGGKLRLEPDLVVLSPAIIPNDNVSLSRILGVELTEDGFFKEAENKFRPVDFLTEGIFVCGLAHSPRGVAESIAQAQAAAWRAVSMLARGELVSGNFVSEIVQRQCSQCEQCVRVCPYGARVKDEESDEIVVREALCQGCGACVVACPSGAAKLRGFKDKQVFSLLEAAFSM